MDDCEMCYHGIGKWYLLDENSEVVLCRKCASDLRADGSTVERIEV